MKEEKTNSNSIAAIVFIIIILITMFACNNGGGGGHAPGYSNTSKCTICKKPATHKTTNYGFCDTHWQDAMNYNK